MLLHFAELVQWELAAAEWVAAVVVVMGKKTFLFFWIFVEACLLLLCWVRQSAHRLVV